MRKNQRGFTLLELLVVVAIVAALGGAAMLVYDGLENKAAKGQATYNIAAIDKAVRTFKVVNGAYPSKLDALVVEGTTFTSGSSPSAPQTASSGGWFAGLHANLQGTDASLTTSDGKLAWHSLSSKQATALLNVGVSAVRVIDATLTNEPTTIPNRAFDSPSRGRGKEVAVAAGLTLPIVETKNIAASDSTRLRDITGLDPNLQHIVVVLGLGNNSTIVSDDLSVNTANLSEAPYYTNVAKSEYGRFLLLFHIASDSNNDGTIADSETFTNAKFVGVLDTKGDWLDEEYAEFTGQKP